MEQMIEECSQAAFTLGHSRTFRDLVIVGHPRFHGCWKGREPPGPGLILKTTSRFGLIVKVIYNFHQM